MSDRGGRESRESLFQWIVGAGEEKLAQFAEEVIGNPRVTDAFASAVRGALRTKGQVDRNLESLLAGIGLATRSDHERLLAKLEALQGSLVNVNIKLDRLLAERESRKAPAPRRPPTPPRRQSRPRGGAGGR